MTELESINHLRSNLLTLLDETFGGPSEQGSAYLDRGTGFSQTLEAVTAAQASQPAWPGATTIAAQVFHTRYYLDVLMVYARGGRPDSDWAGSWARSTVSEAEWRELRDSLLDTYASVRSALEGEALPGDDFGGAMLAVLAHSAYHLGAIRQQLSAQARS